MKLLAWLGATVFAFFFRREQTVVLTSHPDFDGSSSILENALKRLNHCGLAPDQTSKDELVFFYRPLLSIVVSREISVSTRDMSTLVIRNYPGGFQVVLGVFFILFMTIFEIVTIASLASGDCRNFNGCNLGVVSLMMLGPVFIYSGLYGIYGVNYLFSRGLYRRIIACLCSS